MFGMTLPRILVNVLGASGGLVMSERFLTSNYQPGKTFLGLPMVSGAGELGWDDITDAALTLAGAAAANMILSRIGK